jgi:hypothetical protein
MSRENELFLLDDIETCLVLDKSHARDAASKLKKATKRSTEPIQVRVAGACLDDDFWTEFAGKSIHALWLALNWSLPYSTSCDTIANAFVNSPLRAIKFGDENAMGTWTSVDPSIDQRLAFFRGIAQCKALQRLWLNDVTSMKNSRKDADVATILSGLAAALEEVGSHLTHFEISGCRAITDAANVATLARALATLTNVESLTLTHNTYTAENLPAILGAITSPNLRHLNIGYNAFGATGFKLLTSTQPFATNVLPKLEELHICRCNLQWDASEAAAAADMAAKVAPLEALLRAAPRLVVLDAGENLKTWAQFRPTLLAMPTHPRDGEWRLFNLRFSNEATVDSGDGRLVADLVARNRGIERLDMTYLKFSPQDQKLVADVIVADAPKLAYVGVLFGDSWEQETKVTIDDHVKEAQAKAEKYDKK